MAKIISVAIQKGGTGKTTTSLALSSYLSKVNFKVLALDLDPQCNMTSVFLTEDYLKLDHRKSMWRIVEDDFLLNGDLNEIIHKSKLPNLDIIPAHTELSVAEVELSGKLSAEQRLSRILERVKDKYDYIIIDCPPSLGRLTVNAFLASDFVLVPVTPNAFDVDGLNKLRDTLVRVSKLNSKDIKVAGILVTRYDPQTLANKAVYDSLKENFGNLVFNTRIPKNTDLEKANIMRQDIFSYAPKSAGAVAYSSFFMKEFIPLLNE